MGEHKSRICLRRQIGRRCRRCRLVLVFSLMVLYGLWDRFPRAMWGCVSLILTAMTVAQSLLLVVGLKHPYDAPQMSL